MNLIIAINVKSKSLLWEIKDETGHIHAGGSSSNEEMLVCNLKLIIEKIKYRTEAG